ncbi:SMP-30/gluconolactonase/LRE family protein [Chloroflexota bacterium]
MNAHRWFKVISLLIMGLLLSISAIQTALVIAAEPPPDFLTKWGTEGTGDGEFSYPYGVAVDASANVYVADTMNHRIQKFDSDGTYITQWGSFGSGDGQFDQPTGVAFDTSGNVYVADSDACRIQKFDSDGNFITKWGSPGIDYGQLNNPTGVAIDGSDNVYVVDSGSSVIRMYDSNGFLVNDAFCYGDGTVDGSFDNPFGIAVDASANVYVADTMNHRIQKFDGNGNFITKWGLLGSDDGQFSQPYGVAVDAFGYVYVTDSGNRRIQKFDGSGNFITKWGSLGSDDGQFYGPLGVAVNASGNIYVAEANNHRIQVFQLAEQPTVATGAATETTATSSILNGNLESLGWTSSVNVSFEYGTTDSYGNATPVQVKTSIGPFSADLIDLLPETSYHFRIKAEGNGVAYGEDMTFNTLTLQLPVVTNDAAVGTITLGGTLDSLGSALAVDVSFEYGTTTSYGNSTPVQTMTSTGAFSATIENLIPQSNYHFRAKAVGDDTVYGEDATFGPAEPPPPQPPPPEPIVGDANEDGELNALDITKIERLVAGLD